METCSFSPSRHFPELPLLLHETMVAQGGKQPVDGTLGHSRQSAQPHAAHLPALSPQCFKRATACSRDWMAALPDPVPAFSFRISGSTPTEWNEVSLVHRLYPVNSQFLGLSAAISWCLGRGRPD